ncbi:MAG: cysteine hydrolase family protein [Phycisphaerae bacterium]
MDYDRILLDIETQKDFFQPGGSCYTQKAGEALRQIDHLFAFAKAERIPVISTLLRVRPGEQGPLASVPHCVEGTEGEEKVARTILPSSIDLGLRNSTDLPPNLLEDYQQVIFEKRDTDLFAHARAERLITELGPSRWIICGAGMARGIVEAAVGLRARGHEVTLASDAALHLRDEMAEMAARRMAAKEVQILPTAEIVGEEFIRRRNAKTTRRRSRKSSKQKVPA